MALQETPFIGKILEVVVGDQHENGNLQYWLARVCYFGSVFDGHEATRFQSSEASKGYGDAQVSEGDYKGALNVYEHGLELSFQDPELLRRRCFVKAKLGDFEGALVDVNKVIESGYYKPFGLQERGILKRMTGDLNGALADLNKALDLETNDYERLKHCGLVKFLLLDEDGARADAKWALRIKPSIVDSYEYGKLPCRGITSVEYLGYKLK